MVRGVCKPNGAPLDLPFNRRFYGEVGHGPKRPRRKLDNLGTNDKPVFSTKLDRRAVITNGKSWTHRNCELKNQWRLGRTNLHRSCSIKMANATSKCTTLNKNEPKRDTGTPVLDSTQGPHREHLLACVTSLVNEHQQEARQLSTK